MTEYFEGFDLTTFWEDSEYADENYTDDPLTDEMIASVEEELGVRIPASYIALMKTRNGGVPRDNCFPTQVPTSWAEDHVSITGFLGIGREKTHSLCGELGNKFMLEEWGYPDIGICICDCPSAGHDMIMLDYRKCGRQGEPEVVHVDQESDYRITFLANDFETFIRGLVNGTVFDDSDDELSKDSLGKIDEKNSYLDFDSDNSVLEKGKSTSLLFLHVFAKVMAVTALLFFLLFFSMHYDDLTGPVSQVMFAVVFVFGYCLFYAFWVGLIAGIFAVLWRLFGFWVFVPVLGALLGAVLAVVLAFYLMEQFDFQGAGLHGGGDIAAFLMVGFFVICSIAGAISGGLISGLLALIIVLIKRRGRNPR